MPAARADVLAAYVHSDEIAHAWHLSWMGVLFASRRTGPYLAMRCGTDGLPAARNKVAGQAGFTPIYDYPRDRLVQVAGTGSAMIVIHRSVVERIYAANGPAWYSRMTNPSTGQLVGEDLSFCARASSLDFPIHVDTSVKTNHLKPIWLQEADYQHPGEVER